MEQLGSHWTDFHEILNLSIFRKSTEKLQVSLKSVKNNEYFTWRPIYICLSYLVQFFLEWKMFQKKKVLEKIKTHILCSITFFFRKSCRLCNDVKKKYCIAWQTTNDNTAHAQCMVDTYDYEHTVTIHKTYCFSTATMVARKRINVTLYVPCMSCFKLGFPLST
jgi:hypothetical protein